MRAQVLRSRWAAIGAAVAVTLGAGGISFVDATTSSGEMPVYAPVEPCRLLDTRPNKGIGGRTTPLAAAEVYTLDGWGSNGQCTLPTKTTALALNVTAINPSALTHLTLFPGDGTPPNASHLNPAPGQPPTPNAVNVDLDTSGHFSIFNFQGAVHVIIDVVGYYDDHIHTGADIVDESITGADIDNSSLTHADMRDEPGIVFEYQTSGTNLSGPSTVNRIVQTSIRVPDDGHLVVQVSGYYTVNSAGNDAAYCQFTKGAKRSSLNVLVPAPEPWFPLEDFATNGSLSHFSSHAVISVSAADNPPSIQFGQVIGVDCVEVAGSVSVDDVSLTVTYHRTRYTPFSLAQQG